MVTARGAVARISGASRTWRRHSRTTHQRIAWLVHLLGVSGARGGMFLAEKRKNDQHSMAATSPAYRGRCVCIRARSAMPPRGVKTLLAAAYQEEPWRRIDRRKSDVARAVAAMAWAATHTACARVTCCCRHICASRTPARRAAASGEMLAAPAQTTWRSPPAAATAIAGFDAL
jgi:hypothetical protein